MKKDAEVSPKPSTPYTKMPNIELETFVQSNPSSHQVYYLRSRAVSYHDRLGHVWGPVSAGLEEPKALLGIVGGVQPASEKGDG